MSSNHTSTHHSHSSSHTHHSSGSHHSSHSHSHRSSRKKRQKSTDPNAYKKTRYFFAFLLFVFITVFGFSLVANTTVMSRSRAADIFVNRQYATALAEDVRLYGSDMCKRNNIDADLALNSLDTQAIINVDRAYVLGTLALDEEFSNTTYLDKLDELQKTLKDDINSAITDSKSSVYPTQKDGADKMSAAICDYLKDRVEFPYMDKLITVINLGSTADLAVIIVSAVLSVALFLLVITLGSEVYRTLRSVSHALFASALISFFTYFSYQIVKGTKSIGIYPQYLNASLMRYLDFAAGRVLLLAVMLVIFSLFVDALIWKLKSETL